MVLCTSCSWRWPWRDVFTVGESGGFALLPFFVVWVFVALYLSLPYIKCIRIDPVRGISFPARAVAVLGKSGAEGNLAIEFNWGEYAIWHLSPRFKVSLDGRRETIYSDEVRKENLNFAFGIGDWDKLIRDRDTHMALVQKTRAVFNL